MSKSACPGKSNFLAHDELDTSDNLTKFWEVEGSIPVQISDIQGRLKQKVLIWKNFTGPSSCVTLYGAWVSPTA